MEPKVVCEGLEFPEGPVWHPEAGLLVTEIQGQRVSRVSGGSYEVVARTGGGANGMTLGPDGALYVTNNGGIAPGWTAPDAFGGRVQRVTMDGVVEDVATEFEGTPLVAPNDLCFGPDGLLYFTDPRWEHGKELQTQGRIHRTDLSGKVELLYEGGLFTNGLGFSPGGGLLYVALTYEQKLVVHDWSVDGLSGMRDFCSLPAGFPDGFCLDARGRLYVAATIGNGVQVFGQDGAHVELLGCGEGSMITNCAIAPDGTLYVTDSGRGLVLAFELGLERLPLY